MADYIDRYFEQVRDAFKLGNTETAYNAPIMQLLSNFDCQPRDLSGGRSGITGENIDIKLWRPNDEPSETEAFAGVEVKKIGGIDKRARKNIQIETKLFGNVILTDNGRWEFWHLNGEGEPELFAGVKILDFKHNELVLLKDNVPLFVTLVQAFMLESPVTIRSATRLAEYMAIHARTIRDIIKGILKVDEHSNPLVTERQRKLPMFQDLYALYLKIKSELSPKLNTASFADMYAQTIVYGLFVARYNDPTQEDFSRQEALGLLQKESPLLMQFFIHITTTKNLHPTLITVIDKLCALYQLCNLADLLDTDDTGDTIIHFYEDFLTAYDPVLRKSLGVFYTPRPVVHYLVEFVDRVLTDEFSVEGGLSNNDTFEVDVPSEPYKVSYHKNAREKTTKRVTVPKVAVLDPATGTGTFHAEIIKYVKDRYFGSGKAPFYQSYIEQPDGLMSRLIGFEIMMTSYVVAHLKIRRTIDETLGHASSKQLPSNIFLTNTLAPVQSEKERVNEMNLFLDFSGAISDEAYHADTWKCRRPVKVIIGNPPYLASSTTPFDISAYKTETDGIVSLDEKNSKWLNDDYVKFFKFSENILNAGHDGVLAFVSNNGYLDNMTFRGMRASLLRSFDHIYIINLHGNSLKKEKAPGGGKDENVFDITVGISLFVGIKKSNKKDWASVSYADVYGTRQHKFEILNKGDIPFKDVHPDNRTALFVPQNDEEFSRYEKGISLKQLFTSQSAGIVTGRDKLCIQPSKQDIERVVTDFEQKDSESLRNEYQLGRDVQDWSVQGAKDDVMDQSGVATKVAYRIFDDRWTYYSGKTKGFICRPRFEVMQNMQESHYENIALTFTRSDKSQNPWAMIFVSQAVTESCYLTTQTAGIATVAPLYVHNEQSGKWASNIDTSKLHQLCQNLDSVPEPLDVFDYCYGVLNDPNYREKYEEYLKRDYPRVPVARDNHFFDLYASAGAQLRKLHLMQANVSAELSLIKTDKNNLIINKIKFRNGSLSINSETSISGISDSVWQFRIGGYQVIEKWFKSHRGEVLNYEKFNHISMIVAILEKTILIQNSLATQELAD